MIWGISDEGKIRHVASAAPMIIKGDRFTKYGGIPILGRGYSAATNSFQSSCLEVNSAVISEPAIFNYDCE